MADRTTSDPLAPRILLVEDEPKIRKLLRASLESRGYRTTEASTSREALVLAAQDPPDLILLDLGLPDGDGIEMTKRLRTWTSVPIVVLSARGGERDKVLALDAGADDYITKPFGVGELAARVRVALRHVQPLTAAPSPIVTSGDFRIDFGRRQVFHSGTEVKLTPTEYRLVELLARNIGKVITHDQLLREVWGPPYVGETQYLRVFMRQLRQKLESDPSRPQLLLTELGVGYRMTDASNS